ncbi:MAG: BrxA/BrxB family bacilliredoxin [candidate division Zixibacteria bacterium]|nr:BrxA/BrxB family bacilliredoxin [candidate division Zixibacteria bacterium]
MERIDVMMPSRYDREAVAFMWKELQDIGVQPLSSAAAVDRFLADGEGTSLLVVNSVCGCAARMARPAVALALQHEVIPDRMGTVFAGVDMDATAKAREYMPDIAPSSPSVFLFKNGKLVHAVHRSEIEGRHPEDIAGGLIASFSEHCSAQGPSVSPDVVRQIFKLTVAPACGSSFERPGQGE